MATFTRVEIWTETAAGSGALVADFAAEALATATLKQSLTGTETLTFTVSRLHSSIAEIVQGRIARVVWSDSSLDTEWRISDLQDQSGSGDRGQIQITGQALLLDLARAPYFAFDSAGRPTFDYSATQLTATQWMAYVTAACTAAPLPYSVSVGTVDFTNKFDLAGDFSTALEIVRAIQQPGRAPGDFVFRRNGSTDYKLDLLTSRGSSATTVRVQTARNLLENARRRTLVNLGTKIIPRGNQGAALRDMSQVVWRVQTVFSGTVAYLEDPYGGTDPIAFDDQLNGLYVAPVASTFSSQVISDSAVTNSAITVASTAGWTGGTTLLRFFRTATSVGQRLVSLSHPTRVTSPASGGYGPVTRILDIPTSFGDTNQASNPWMSTWTTSASPPDSWSRSTVTGVTYSRESTTIRNGTYSQKIVAAGAVSYSDVRVYSPTATPYTTSGLRHSAHVWVYVESVGAALQRYVRVRVMKPDLTVSYADGDYVDPAEIVGAWTKISVANADLSAATAGVVVVAEFGVDNNPNANTSLTAYVDSVGLGETDVPIEDVVFSGAIPMWQRANVLLGVISTPIAGYNLRLADLDRLDGSVWAEPLTLGGSIEVVDPDLSTTTTQRLVELEQNLLNPIEAVTQLQTLDALLTDAVTGATGGSLLSGWAAGVPEGVGSRSPATKPTAIRDLGISDVYTKTEVLALLSGKANIGTGGLGDGTPLTLGGMTYTSTGAMISAATAVATGLLAMQTTTAVIIEVFGIRGTTEVFFDVIVAAAIGAGGVEIVWQADLVGSPRTRAYTIASSIVTLTLGGAVGQTYKINCAVRRAMES